MFNIEEIHRDIYNCPECKFSGEGCYCNTHSPLVHIEPCPRHRIPYRAMMEWSIGGGPKMDKFIKAVWH